MRGEAGFFILLRWVVVVLEGVGEGESADFEGVHQIIIGEEVEDEGAEAADGSFFDCY